MGGGAIMGLVSDSGKTIEGIETSGVTLFLCGGVGGSAAHRPSLALALGLLLELALARLASGSFSGRGGGTMKGGGAMSFGATAITGRLASGPKVVVVMVTERFSTLGGEPAIVVVTERRIASGAEPAAVVMVTVTAGTEPLNIFFRASSTSSGLQVMPRFSLCAENQARIVVSGIFDAAVSDDSSACVGYGNRVNEAVSAA